MNINLDTLTVQTFRLQKGMTNAIIEVTEHPNTDGVAYQTLVAAFKDGADASYIIQRWSRDNEGNLYVLQYSDGAGHVENEYYVAGNIVRQTVKDRDLGLHVSYRAA